MSGMIAVQTYGVRVHPGDDLVAAIPEDVPYAVRLTMAAIEPFPVEQDDDDEEEPTPSTLTLVKESDYNLPDSDRLIFNSSDEEEDDEDEESDSDEEEELKEVKGSNSKKSSKKSNGKAEESSEEDDEESLSSSDDEDDDEDDSDIETSVICTLGPKFQYQQPLDLVLAPGENVHFAVTGSYAIHITGNYVVDPNDDDYEDEDNEDEFDLSPDEDELMLEDASDEEDDELDDIESRIEEIVEEAPAQKAIPAKEEEPVKSKKNKKKHSNDESLDDLIANEKQSKSKKAKTEETDEGQKQKKNVNFKKDLEQGPSNVQKLEGGLTIEDRATGKGPVSKNGTKVSVRYTGKLRNGKVFDSNTKGKPFSFTLGKGEVIKGWDLGVKGMAAGGERRITVPSHLAYGKKALPGIPANSELIFDVKVVSLR